MPDQWYEVHVLYKSGHTMVFETTKFEYEIRQNGSYEVKWGKLREGALGPTYFNMDEVSAIWAREII